MTDALNDRIAALEAEGAIRRLVARYMEICDVLDADAPMAELGALFTEEATWQGAGAKYDAAFGGHQGRDAIVAFLNGYREPAPHFAANAHFLTSESITVDGEVAEGSWVMLQTPTFADGASFLMAARLNLAFKIEDGRWRIHRFATENLFSRPVDGGWNIDAAIPVPQGPVPQANLKGQ